MIVSKKMEEILIGCSGWNYADTPDKGGWTGCFILTRVPKDFGIIPNSSILQKWIPLSTRNSIPK